MTELRQSVTLHSAGTPDISSQGAVETDTERIAMPATTHSIELP